MNTTLTRAPLTPRRRFGTVVVAAAVAIAIAAVFVGVSQLVRSPDVVDRIEIHNPTGDIVDVLATSGDHAEQMPVTIVEPNRNAVAYDVIDQGDTWVFVFKVADRTIGEIRASRADLEQSHWRVTVPTTDAASPPSGP